MPEILSKWGIKTPEQVIDILALWGDTSDNIPGVPGIGEKTASKLITQYQTVENLLALYTQELSGKVRGPHQTHREQALLSKRLATLVCDTPCTVDLESLERTEPDNDQLKQLFIEFEFNSIGRRLFGDEFKAGRGYSSAGESNSTTGQPSDGGPGAPDQNSTGVLRDEAAEVTPATPGPKAALKTITDVPHQYRIASRLLNSPSSSPPSPPSPQLPWPCSRTVRIPNKPG